MKVSFLFNKKSFLAPFFLNYFKRKAMTDAKTNFFILNISGDHLTYLYTLSYIEIVS